MALRTLLAVWAFLDLCLLAAGILCIVATVIFNNPDGIVMKMVVDSFGSFVGYVLGGAFIATCLLSMPAVFQPKERNGLLKVLNGMLVGVSVITLIIGTLIWYQSLRQLSLFSTSWQALPSDSQIKLQDELRCCGYWNGTAEGLFSSVGGYCEDEVFAAGQMGCQTSITSASWGGTDFDFEQIFTSIYGIEAIIVCFFLATACLINERAILVRFARIEEKRGGGGFV